MQFIPLHDVPELKIECAEVLNEEWKRSLTARLHSLEKSKDGFPVCLVLKENSDIGKPQVIGHSMLSVVRGQAIPSCLVESVVVRKSLRGKGYGRIVMQKTEEYAASKGYKVMYLTTHDKQKFYEHLGYQYCSPVVSFGNDIVPESLACKLLENLNVQNTEDTAIQKTKNEQVGESRDNAIVSKTNISNNSAITSDTVSVIHSSQLDSHTNGTTPTGASKSSSSAPTPPVSSVPPPPPCPVPPPTIKSSSSQDKDISRWDPKLVSWMKKKIV